MLLHCVPARFALAVVLPLAGCHDPAAHVGELSGAGTTTGAPSSGESSEAGTSSDASSGSHHTTATTSTSEGSEGGEGPLLDVGSDVIPGCQGEVGDWIYLLDTDSGLHRIAPAALELETLGSVACEGVELAAALTIARDGTLWAMMVDGEGSRGIYNIEPTTLACTKTAFVDPSADAIFVSSLAFVADGPEAESETLHLGVNVGAVWDFVTPFSLATVDAATLELDVVGTAEIVPTGYYQIADITGTGAGRMWGFFPGETTVIAELDPSDASLVSQHVIDIGVGSPWAFAQWDGRLWLVTLGGDSGSMIRAWDPEDDSLEMIHEGLGVSIVGAAVSTCAPYGPAG